MIRTSSSIWHPISGCHREIRWNHHFNRRFSSDNGLRSYLHLAERHLENLILFQRSSFDESYRRRAAIYDLKIASDYNVFARAKPKTNSYGIEISLGTLLALEDLNHAILSDKKTALGVCIGESTANIEFTQSPFDGLFDSNRFYDYSNIIDHLSKSISNAKSFSFIPIFYKSIPFSEYRQQMADLLTDLGVYWILCHEEAHLYLGHIRYSASQHNAYQSSDISFSELIASIGDNSNPKHRQAAELEADINATTKLVDYFLDMEIFEAYPFLEKGFYGYYDIISESGIPEKEARTGYLLRIIISSIASVLSMFQRCVIKDNADTSFYPIFLKRMINVIVSAFERCATNSQYQPRLGLAQLSGERNANFLHLLSLDLRAAANNTLLNRYKIIDESMNRSENDEVVDILNDVSFGGSLIEFYTLLKRHLPLNYIKNGWHAEFFIGLSRDRCEYIDILREHFLEHRMNETPEILDKVIEDSDQQLRFKEYLQVIV